MEQLATPNCNHVRRTLRSKAGMLAIVVATSLGGTAFAAGTASAVEPAAPSAVTGSKPVIRNDGLAPIAVGALTELQTYIATGDSSVLTSYLKIRDAIAVEVATRLGADPARLISAWDRADYTHQAAMMGAFTQLGVPYRRMASKPGVGFDCSGLTTYAWGLAGVTLIRQSGSQINAASPRSAETAMAGDLLYYPGHAMMYLGIDRAIVHAPYTGRTVEVDNLSSKKSIRFGNPIG